MSIFKSEEQGKLHLIYCPQQVHGASLKQWALLVKDWLGMAAEYHVFNFKDTEFLHPAAYRKFVQFHQALKPQKKEIRSIGLNSKLMIQIKNDGLFSVLRPVEDIEEIKKLVGGGEKKKKAVNVEFFNPFVRATQVTLSVQAGVENEAGKPHLKTPEDDASIGIAGVLNIVSEEFRGAIALCFPTEVFLNVYEAMFDEKHEEVTDEIKDAAGELLNIIFGQAKAELNDKFGFTIQKAIPTVLSGEKLKVHHSSAQSTIVLPFTSSAGEFHIQIQVART
jgi:chemotaxis protein CheX